MLHLKNVLNTIDLDEMIRIDFNHTNKYLITTVSDVLLTKSSPDFLEAEVNGITKSSDKNVLFNVLVTV